ncbi:tail fiber protein / tail tubular protein A [Enterobacter phage 04_vB_Eclo_IJM]|nr:tail fiber protein / tail tubular protein A [Enterobacter phage 04_vB_Eclo_IJM]
MIQRVTFCPTFQTECSTSKGLASENFIVVNSAGAYNRMYIYKFLFRDGVQLQASWSHWSSNRREGPRVCGYRLYHLHR